MKKFNEKFNETLDTLGEIGYWLGVRFERYIEENKDDILELLGILGAFFVMWWITVAIEADKIFLDHGDRLLNCDALRKMYS